MIPGRAYWSACVSFCACVPFCPHSGNWMFFRSTATDSEFVLWTNSNVGMANILETWDVDGDQSALITYTSGSTGRPKGANRTHAGLLEQHLAISRLFPYEPGEVDLTPFPVVVPHNLACGVPTVFPAMDLGKPASVCPERIISQVQQEHATRLGGSPAFMKPVCNYVLANAVSVPSLKVVGSGGAPVPRVLCESMKRAFCSANAYVGYGTTEVDPVTKIHVDDVLSAKGQGLPVDKPCADVELKIVELPEDPGQIMESSLTSYEMEPGEVGEIVVRGKHVVREYLDNPAANRENKIPCDGGLVWHRTGDVGYLDAGGGLWLTGRTKDVVVWQDRSIQPFPVEMHIDAIEGVNRSALVSVKSQNTTVLALQLDSGVSWVQVRSAVTESLKSLDLDRVMVRLVKRIPVDRRHNSKIDRVHLRRRLATFQLKIPRRLLKQWKRT